MGILQVPTALPSQVGILPATKKMITTDSLATTVAAGYLNSVDLQSNPVNSSDIIECLYSYNQQTNSGTYATFIPSISNGTITLVEWINPGNVLTPVVVGNIAKFNSTTGQISDTGIVATSLQTSAVVSPNATSSLLWHDVTCTAAALATAGKVNIQVSSGAKKFKVRDIRVNYSAAGLSGGSGDRLLAITDGTTVYNNAGITAALLGTPINTLWDETGNPVAGTVAMNTSSAAGATIYAQYTGGTLDYTTGSVLISVLTEQVV